MFRKSILLVVIALALATMACGISIDLPISNDIKTGPTEVENVLVVPPDSAEDPELSLIFGAGELYLTPGAEAGVLEGTATYNVRDLKPEIKTTQNQVEITTGDFEIDGFPTFDDKLENIWDFKLSDRPLELEIKAGAYKSELDLGGLSIKNLHISDGAADVRVDFSQLNQVVMDTFRYDTGASNVILRHLANANCRTLIFEGGAGNFELGFSGDLQQDMSVIIEAGLSSLTISVPEGVDAEVSMEGGLSDVSAQGDWSGSGSNYVLSGDGPTIHISLQMAAGSVILRTE